MIDLTLNSIQIPAIAGYTPPFGTQKVSGGLSTQEVNDNIIAAFVRQRPVVVSESTSTSEIQYNATLAINTAGITLTLGAGAFVGCEVTVVSALGGSIAYTGKIGSVTDSLNGGVIVKYMWMGSYWMSISAPVAIGDVYAQMPDVPAPSLLYGGQWQEHPYAGVFMRSQGGNAKAFTPPIAGSFTSSTVFHASAALPAGVAVGDLVICGSEYKTITAISGQNITIDSAFDSYTNITNVLIGQADALQSHSHVMADNVVIANLTNTGNYLPSATSWSATDSNMGLKKSNTQTTGGSETRPKNITARCWLRIA